MFSNSTGPRAQADPANLAQHLADLDQLLAAEGISPDNLDDIDPDTLTEALVRATEQYNLQLFTPVGRHRDLALAVLRRFTEAVLRGDLDRAKTVLDAVQPEPTDQQPAVSHVIGAGLGLLDTWHTDPALQDILWNRSVPGWSVPAGVAAISILGRAREGQAYDSLADLISRFTSLAVLEGTALAVSACLDAVAQFYGTDVQRVATAMLSDHATPPYRFETKPARGRRGRPNRQPKPRNHRQLDQAHTDRLALHDFEVWLHEQELIVGHPIVESEWMETLIRLARTRRFDPHTPPGLLGFIHDFVQRPDVMAEAIWQGVSTAVDYASFQIQTSDCPEQWRDASIDMMNLMEDMFPVTEALAAAIHEASTTDPDQRRAAYATTLVVRKVADMLAWIGKGRPITTTGVLRRADIAEAAELVGISAAGVSRLDPARSNDDQLFHAVTMHEVPLLAPWWRALLAVGLIETTSTRVRRGPTADAWFAGDHPPYDMAETLIQVFVAEAMMQDYLSVPMENRVLTLVTDRLMRAVSPIADDLALEESPYDQGLEPRVRRRLGLFEQAGLLTLRDDGTVTVVPALQGAVAGGLLFTFKAMEHIGATTGAY